MRYVLIEYVDDAHYLDPRPYLAVLPEIGPRLPDGARAFATDPGHYDFQSEHCTKGLRVGSLTLREAGFAALDARLEFAPYGEGAPIPLVIEYRGVTDIEVEKYRSDPSDEEGPAGTAFVYLLLDEILPHKDGCSHEIAFVGGKMRITGADLTATWDDSLDGPDGR